MNQTIEEVNNRDFDKCYFSIMVFLTKINYKVEGSNNIFYWTEEPVRKEAVFL